MRLVNTYDSAVLSDDGVYRYELRRSALTGGKGEVCFVMLNPSTADASKNDPTIRRCISFAIRFGFASLRVVNLFAYRTTKLDVLPTLNFETRMGPMNEYHVAAALVHCDTIICAWGGHAQYRTNEAWAYLVNKANFLYQMDGNPPMPLFGRVFCLGVCADGSPRHPLMLPNSTELKPWPKKLTEQQVYIAIDQGIGMVLGEGHAAKKAYVSYNTFRMMREPIDYHGLEIIPSESLTDDQVYVSA